MSGRGGRQVIPRPPEVRPGRPAPWAELPVEEREIDAAVLRKVFGGRVGRPTEPEVESVSRPSAVLAAFYEAAGDGGGDPLGAGGGLEVLLTRRSWSLRNHTGEVSFPGGRSDPGEDPVTTALREAEEEIALDPADVEVLGELDHFVTMVSRSFIVPVVALLPGRPVLRPSAYEVDEILYVPVADLLADGVYREERWRFPASSPWASPSEAGAPDEPVERPVYFFELEADTVWGATANMLRHLLCITLGLPADQLPS